MNSSLTLSCSYLQLLGELIFGRAKFVHVGDLSFEARLVLFQDLHVRRLLLRRQFQFLQARGEFFCLRLPGLAGVGELFFQGAKKMAELFNFYGLKKGIEILNIDKNC